MLGEASAMQIECVLGLFQCKSAKNRQKLASKIKTIKNRGKTIKTTIFFQKRPIFFQNHTANTETGSRLIAQKGF